MRNMRRRILMPTEEEILEGKVTDIYFPRALKVLKYKGLEKSKVVMEAFVKKFPDPNYNFGIFTGIHDVVRLLGYVAEEKNCSFNVYAMEDGEIFFPWEPVLQIEGSYEDFAIYENVILGLISKASGIATKAARIRIAAKDKILMSFGTRRVHPGLAPMIERSCYIAGFDGVSNVLGAELMGKKAVGTMPHALILIFGNSAEAFKAYDEALPEGVPRIALIDTFGSPKEEALIAEKVLKDKLDGVRIDSGDLKKLGKEVRWELNLRGRKKVKLYCSGGLDEYRIQELVDIYDGFGVGTRVADAPTMDFALKIVEVEGEPRAKAGNLSGMKYVIRRQRNGELKDYIMPCELYKGRAWNNKVSEIASEGRPLLKQYMKDGKMIKNFESVDEIRNRVLKNLKSLPEDLKKLEKSNYEPVIFVGYTNA